MLILFYHHFQHGDILVFIEVKIDSNFSRQVAGLPTNIGFLQQLASHWAFQKGLVETHFIEHFKSDLFPDSDDAMEKVAYAAANISASLLVACVCKCEHNESLASTPGQLFVPYYKYNQILPTYNIPNQGIFSLRRYGKVIAIMVFPSTISQSSLCKARNRT